MKVLVHYTTQKSVIKKFSRKGSRAFDKSERIKHISDFYKKYNRTQETLFFVVYYYDTTNTDNNNYTASKISYNKDANNYIYTQAPNDVRDNIYQELGLKTNTYERDIYYKIYTIEDSNMKFMNRKTEKDLNKIKLKFFSWDELLSSNETLFKEINNIIFNRENVLKVASTYKPKIRYDERLLQKKYADALKSIGFISEEGIDVKFNMLHGDIGEFVMHVMLSEFLHDQSIEKYIYPKLVFKSSPKMPIYGNDGTIYVKDRKEIYYLEAKFYSDLNIAINKAINSLKEHNEMSNETFTHKIEMFRNIMTDELDEIIEIDDEVSENLVIFIMCDSHTKYSDILKVVRKNKKFYALKENYSILLFVLPVLSKSDYLKHFKNISKQVWEDNNGK